METGLLPAAGHPYVSCKWIDSDGKTDENEKLIISGYQSTPAQTNVLFRTQVKTIQTGSCYKRIVSLTKDGKAIDENENFVVTNTLTVDTTKLKLWGKNGYDLEFSAGGTAGTATQLHLWCYQYDLKYCGSMQSDNPSLFDPEKTERLEIVLNGEDEYYQFASNMLTTNYDHLDSDKTGQVASSTFSSGQINIDFKGAKWRTWKDWWISSSIETDPSVSLNTRTPTFPAYPPNMQNYEICVF